MVHTANLGCDVKALRQSCAEHSYTDVLHTSTFTITFLCPCTRLHTQTAQNNEPLIQPHHSASLS